MNEITDNNGPNILSKFADGDMILAFEHWCTLYNWWTPNTCPHGLLEDGKLIRPATHNWQWYQIDYNQLDLNFPEEDLASMVPTRNEILQHYLNVQFEHVRVLDDHKHDIPNYKYLYPVFIHNPSYFTQHESVGFKYVDPLVITDVKEGRAKIVLTMPFEGFINLPGNRDIEILNSWCTDAGLSADHVYYIHGDCNVSNLPANLNFTYVPAHAFHCWLPHPRVKIEKFEPIDDKNLFLAYARRDHDHRLLFVCELIQNGLMDRGLVSYQGSNRFETSAQRVANILGRTDLVEAANVLDSMTPLSLDLDLSAHNPIHPELSHYRMTFLSTVLETHSNTDTLFFSEKIWKPISAGQPFMLIAGMNYLTELKRLGYKTFDKWFDESYDQMPNLNDRVSCVISELVRLSKLSDKQLLEMRNDMREVLFHNQQRFAIQYGEEYNANPNHFLYNEFKKIWDNF